jgi:hypothetical protein
VPVVTNLRSAAHTESGYDRVTFDITGPIPNYSVQYVSHVVGDASGNPITVPGQAYLVIRFNPAQGHTDAGVTTVPTGPQTLNYPMLKGYAVAGDFEGVFTVALGLARTTGFRVGELSGRVYIDVAQ